LLGKQNIWTDGRDLGALYKTRHKDEAVNQMFEVNSKDYTQRIHIIDCPINAKGLPIIAEELLPPPLPKPDKSQGEDFSLDEQQNEPDGSLQADEVTNEDVGLQANSERPDSDQSDSNDSGNQPSELAVNRH